MKHLLNRLSVYSVITHLRLGSVPQSHPKVLLHSLGCLVLCSREHILLPHDLLGQHMNLWPNKRKHSISTKVQQHKKKILCGILHTQETDMTTKVKKKSWQNYMEIIEDHIPFKMIHQVECWTVLTWTCLPKVMSPTRAVAGISDRDIVIDSRKAPSSSSSTQVSITKRKIGGRFCCLCNVKQNQFSRHKLNWTCIQ